LGQSLTGVRVTWWFSGMIRRGAGAALSWTWRRDLAIGRRMAIPPFLSLIDQVKWSLAKTSFGVELGVASQRHSPVGSKGQSAKQIAQRKN